MEKAKLNRINELAHLSKVRKLTHDELVEQGKLRAEFISEIRADLKRTLDSIEYVEDVEQKILN